MRICITRCFLARKSSRLISDFLDVDSIGKLANDQRGVLGLLKLSTHIDLRLSAVDFLVSVVNSELANGDFQ